MGRIQSNASTTLERSKNISTFSAGSSENNRNLQDWKPLGLGLVDDFGSYDRELEYSLAYDVGCMRYL